MEWMFSFILLVRYFVFSLLVSLIYLSSFREEGGGDVEGEALR